MSLFKIGHRLTNEQRQQRSQGTFSSTFTVTDQRNGHNPIPSFFLNMYQQLYSDLMRRLRVDISILDYNYLRLFKCIDMMTNERIQYRFQKMHFVIMNNYPSMNMLWLSNFIYNLMVS